MSDWEHKFEVYKGGVAGRWYARCRDPRCVGRRDIMSELLTFSDGGYWGRRTREEAHIIGVHHQEMEILKSFQVHP